MIIVNMPLFKKPKSNDQFSKIQLIFFVPNIEKSMASKFCFVLFWCYTNLCTDFISRYKLLNFCVLYFYSDLHSFLILIYSKVLIVFRQFIVDLLNIINF